MSGAVEVDFVRHLLKLESVEVIAAEGLDAEVLPTVDVRNLYGYAMEYFFSSGKTQTINPTALASFEVSPGVSYIEVLADLDITLDEPDLEIHDCISKLKGQFLLHQVNQFQRQLAQAISEAPITDRLEIVSIAAGGLFALVRQLEPKRYHLSTADLGDRLLDYQSPDPRSGMSIGFPEIDQHLGYIWPGEVAIFAAPPKFGKSLSAIIAAIAEWKRGRRVVLFSLENPMEMTQDRFITVGTHMDATRWQRKECTAEEMILVQAWVDAHKSSPNPIEVISPSESQRDVESMMRMAQLYDADSVIIDQLSHIKHLSPGRKPRYEVVRDIMQDVADFSRQLHLPVLLFHQISREGKKEADKTGWYRQDSLSESSEVERSATHILTAYQSRDAQRAGRAVIQLLADRRVDNANWDIVWQPRYGHGSVISQVDLD